LDLANETPFPAVLLATVLDTERMAASIVLRVTYTFDEGPLVRGQLALAPEQVWIVSRKPWESPQGQMEQDLPFMRGGVDLFVFGAARAAQRVPVPRMTVEVEISPAETDGRRVFRRRAHVSGKRVWVRDSDALVPSRAAPFVEVPLAPESAFGGTSEWDGLSVPWMDNPAGVGFCMLEAQVEGTPLPQLEEPDGRMSAWSDRPPVCGFGFCPMASTARFRNGFVLTDEFEMKEMRPQFFNAAYPAMIAPEARAGDLLRLSGVLHDGPLELVLPPAPASVRLRFGDTVAERIPFIDQIGVEVDVQRAFITYRFPFRYVVRPRELREATLTQRKE
jgi:hypothetical protein